MKRQEIFAALILCAILLLPSCSKTGDTDQATEKISVEVATVARGSVAQTIAYDGDIEGEVEVEVFSKVPDRIEQFFVDVGDHVEQGAPIARIRATTIQQTVRQAEAGLVAARAQEANVRLEFERSERLYKENAMSLQQLDAVKTQFEAVKSQREQAEAGLESAKSLLTDALVSSPITGIVARRSYETGDMASPAQALVTVVQMKRVRARIQVGETDLGKIRVGQPAQIRVRSYPDRMFEGKVHKVSPVLDRLARMAEVEVLAENRDGALRPGMFGRVEVKTGMIDNVIVVPRHAIIESPTLQEGAKGTVTKNYYVYVVREEKAEQRKLEVKYASHEYLAVSDGLAEGDKIVVLGQNTLRDGAPVLVTKEESAQ